jgi:hypothetical protein
MNQYLVNIAERHIRGIDGEARYVHWARVELPTAMPDEARRQAKDIAARFPAP